MPNMYDLGIGAFVPVDKGIEVAARFLLDGQRVQTSFWFQSIGIPNATNLEDAVSIITQWWDGIHVHLSTALTITEIQGYDRTAQVRPSFVQTIFIDGNGDIVGDFAPSNVAMCVSLLTGYGHRSGRGRSYLMGIPDGEVIGNTFDPPFVNQIKQAYDNIIVTAISYNLTYVVASRYHDKEPRPLGVCVPITNTRIDPTVDSQRRRLPGRGR